jgi:quercetin dioxygenase-like cupin family protein
MKRFFVPLVALLALVPAAAFAAPKAAAPGTCAIAFGPNAIPGDAIHSAVVLHMDIAPGRVANWHTHPGAEYMAVDSGSGWLEVQGQPRTALKPGGVYAIDPNVPHRAHNSSATGHLTWTGFLVGKTGEHVHTVLKKGAGPWTPGCATRI